jgi:hypothetical protein
VPKVDAVTKDRDGNGQRAHEVFESDALESDGCKNDGETHRKFPDLLRCKSIFICSSTGDGIMIAAAELISFASIHRIIPKAIWRM